MKATSDLERVESHMEHDYYTWVKIFRKILKWALRRY